MKVYVLDLVLVWKVINRIFLVIKNHMEDNPPSLTQIQETSAPTPIYSTIASHNYHFRVFTTQFNRNTLLIFYFAFMCIAFAFAAAILILAHSLHLQPYPFLITLAFALVPLTWFAIYNRQALGISIVLSSIFLNIIIIVLAILLSLSIKYSGVAFGVYVAVQTISNCFLRQNPGKVLLKVLMMVQLLIICLKIDEIISLEWDQTLFGLIIIFFFLLVTSCCVFVYSFLVSWCLSENCYEVKRLGLRYIGLNLLSFSCAMSIPIWAVFINGNYHIPCIVALICTFLTAVFSFFKRTPIALFLCKTLEIATKEEIRFQVEQKDPKCLPNLFRASDNWFVEKYDASTCESNLEKEECVACMDSAADTVWQPCGHCILCSKCMQQLINTQVIKCPICKAKPSQIVTLSARDEMSEKVLRKNEYEISGCILIRHL